MKLVFVAASILLTMATVGWELVLLTERPSDNEVVVQAIPIIRFERFDQVQRSLMVGLFNPGVLSMEINRTALSYEPSRDTAASPFVIKEYGDKPLVLDPGDTILVPLVKNMPKRLASAREYFWGQLDIRIPGQVDFYSLYHRFNVNPLKDKKIGNILGSPQKTT